MPGRLVVLGAPADGSVSRAELTTVPSPQEGVCAQRADARQVLRVLPGAWRALKTREPRSRSCPIHCLHVCSRHAWLLRAGLARGPCFPAAWYSDPSVPGAGWRQAQEEARVLRGGA